MPRKSGVTIQTTIYQKFKGVDFSTDPALVDRTRSPLCTNIISDVGGMPEKRCGWRTLHTLDGRVNGLFSAVYTDTSASGGDAGASSAKTYLYAHAGTKLYTWDETEAAPVLRLSGLHDGKSRGVSLGGKFWIVTGGEYLVCKGNTVEPVSESEDAYVPTTVITRDPDGGGVPYEAVNLLSRYRKNGFQTDGTTKTFLLDSAPIDSEGTVRAWVWGEEVTNFTVDRANGKITFSSAPAAPSAGSADGLVVQFPKTVEGYADLIGKCTIISTYGAGSSDRVVVSGNPEHPNRDWISGLGDPTYFPDLGYSTVGIEGVAILGYCRIGAAQAIVKEDNGQDSTVFFRSASVSEDGEAAFTLSQALSGVGAVSAGSFANLLDEPLFVSGTGVYAITTNYLTGERVGQNRSYFLNALLTKEDLRNAEAVSYKGMYLLAFPNGHVYVLDARQNKTYRSESLGDFVYEGYYWENVPARCWLNHERGVGEGVSSASSPSGGGAEAQSSGIGESGETEILYFGTEGGDIRRFNTDDENMTRFSDDGAAIDAVWATKMDDDGDATILKTMIKRGCAVTLKPYYRSSATICFRTDRDPADRAVKHSTLDIFRWEDIDFARFTFDSNDGAREIFFNSKVKKYKRLQILIRNAEAEEGFGVFAITKHYVEGNFAKR